MDAIGLKCSTTNKHFRKIKQIHDLVHEGIDRMAEIRFTKFMVPDLKDEREARDVDPVDQATEILSPPAWTGGESVSHRVVSGITVKSEM